MIPTRTYLSFVGASPSRKRTASGPKQNLSQITNTCHNSHRQRSTTIRLINPPPVFVLHAHRQTSCRINQADTRSNGETSLFLRFYGKICVFVCVNGEYNSNGVIKLSILWTSANNDLLNLFQLSAERLTSINIVLYTRNANIPLNDLDFILE